MAVPRAGLRSLTFHAPHPLHVARLVTHRPRLDACGGHRVPGAAASWGPASTRPSSEWLLYGQVLAKPRHQRSVHRIDRWLARAANVLGRLDAEDEGGQGSVGGYPDQGCDTIQWEEDGKGSRCIDPAPCCEPTEPFDIDTAPQRTRMPSQPLSPRPTDAPARTATLNFAARAIVAEAPGPRESGQIAGRLVRWLSPCVGAHTQSKC